MDNKQLIEKAKEAMEFSYSPYSNFKVGAALLTKSGKVFTGCNIENASFGATNCAERTAIYKAISEGYKDFEKIAIVGVNNDFTYPCGICRQVLAEFLPEGEIILANDKEIITYKLEELLPKMFTKEDLEK